MQPRLAATEVIAMTSTPSPIWRLRADAITPAIMAVNVHGLTNPNSGPGGAWVRYLSAMSETPKGQAEDHEKRRLPEPASRAHCQA